MFLVWCLDSRWIIIKPFLRGVVTQSTHVSYFMISRFFSSVWHGCLTTGKGRGEHWQWPINHSRGVSSSETNGRRDTRRLAGIEADLHLESVKCLSSFCPSTSAGGLFFLLLFGARPEKMSNVNWKPFVFGGLASVTAECGEWREVRQGGQAAWITIIYLNLCGELLSSKCTTSSRFVSQGHFQST